MADLRKRSFKEKFIGDVSLSDYTVSLTGSIAGKKEGGFFLADGTGEVFVNSSDVEGEFNEGMFVRVFGRVVPFEGGFELQAEVVQDMKGLDKEAYNKIKDKISKADF